VYVSSVYISFYSRVLSLNKYFSGLSGVYVSLYFAVSGTFKNWIICINRTFERLSINPVLCWSRVFDSSALSSLIGCYQ
jgi:hypothetical protein